MGTIDIAAVGPADMERFVRAAVAFWGENPEDEIQPPVQETLDRPLLARLDGEEVGVAAVIDYQLALPGGGTMAMDGVTWVVVSPAARRRGVLRAMMGFMLESAHQRRIPVLGLGASESMIYRRFGYGVASHIGVAEIDTAHAALRVPLADPGRLRMQPLDGVVAVWLDVARRETDRVGRIHRSEAVWRRLAAGGAKPRGGMGLLQVAVHHDRHGVIDGFVNYRTEDRWSDEVADGTIHVRDLVALSGEAHVALWQHVLAMDLMEHLRMERFWLDDPIQHLLLDRRRLRIRPRDDLHLRVVDAVACLQARRYSREDALVLEVCDPACPDIGGRYRLEGGLDGATASPTDHSADLVLDGPSLGSLLLGDVSVAALERAGLVREVSAGAARRASAMFSWSPRPWLSHMF